jgi:hypothetical protein
VTTYSLTFKQIGGDEIAVSESRNLDSACDRVLEYLDYGYELIAATRGDASALSEVMVEVNYRIDNPDWEESEEEFARNQRNEDRRDYYAGRGV